MRQDDLVFGVRCQQRLIIIDDVFRYSFGCQPFLDLLGAIAVGRGDDTLRDDAGGRDWHSILRHKIATQPSPCPHHIGLVLQAGVIIDRHAMFHLHGRAHPALRLLDDVPGLMRQMPFLAWREVDRNLCKGA